MRRQECRKCTKSRNGTKANDDDDRNLDFKSRIDQDNLQIEEQQDLLALLRMVEKIFAGDDTQLNFTTLTEHKIWLENDRPIAKRPYWLSPQEKLIIGKEIEMMLSKNIVRSSCRPYAAL